MVLTESTALSTELITRFYGSNYAEELAKLSEEETKRLATEIPKHKNKQATFQGVLGIYNQEGNNTKLNTNIKTLYVELNKIQEGVAVTSGVKWKFGKPE